tara:strand:+ start:584 stop:898 length:315 start_codon:yes stop_codon:yes gene_type:complete
MEKSDLDAKQIIDNLFDPEISEILAEMENGPKHCTFLSEKFGIVPEDLQEKLSYLIQHKFVNQNGTLDDVQYSVDSKKLSEVMSSGHDYKNVEDGLAKMDSFLN